MDYIALIYPQVTCIIEYVFNCFCMIKNCAFHWYIFNFCYMQCFLLRKQAAKLFGSQGSVTLWNICAPSACQWKQETIFYKSWWMIGRCNLHLKTSESVATLPPFGPIEGQKWFDRISSQWESQKNRFALIYFGKIRFLPPCVWNIPFMSYSLW
jgi:hypothetical protein